MTKQEPFATRLGSNREWRLRLGTVRWSPGFSRSMFRLGNATETTSWFECDLDSCPPPEGVQVIVRGGFAALDQGPDIPFRHAPSGAEVGSGGSRSFQGQNAPGYDRDPSGVKQKNLSLTTGPQIGSLFLARSLRRGSSRSSDIEKAHARLDGSV